MRVKQEHLNILVDYNLNCNPVNSLKIMLFGILANLQTLMLIINSSNVDKTIPPNGIKIGRASCRERVLMPV